MAASNDVPNVIASQGVQQEAQPKKGERKPWCVIFAKPPAAPPPTRGRRLEKLRGTPVELEMRPLSLPPRRPQHVRKDTKRWDLSVKLTASRIGKTRQGARFARAERGAE